MWQNTGSYVCKGPFFEAESYHSIFPPTVCVVTTIFSSTQESF